MSKVLDLWADMTGVVMDYALKTPPSSAWMMCYGQVLTPGNPVTARLRQKLIDDGFTYGQDGTSGNPLIPDSRGRTTAAPDNLGGTAANRLSGATAIGGSVGAESHTLTVGQLPTHAHTATAASGGGHAHTATAAAGGTHAHTASTAAAGDHAHTMNMRQKVSSGTPDNARMEGAGNGTVYDIASNSAGSHAHTVTVNAAADHTHTLTVAAAAAHAHTITVANEGSGNAHPIVQPTLLLNKIIKL